MDSELTWRAMSLIPLVLSLTVHEFAHAWSAYLLGDDTAARQGRLTLNPIVHMDPLGTFLLPLLGIPFGWAKPVPVDPARFTRKVSMGTGMMVTAAAGPFSNAVLAVLCAVGYGLLYRLAPATLGAQPGLASLLLISMQMNIGLAIFNMLPIPPLDGSRVVEGLIPYGLRPAWARLAAAGPLLLLVALYAGGSLTRAPREWANGQMVRLIEAVALPSHPGEGEATAGADAI
jgi:Zn-dependent protease